MCRQVFCSTAFIFVGYGVFMVAKKEILAGEGHHFPQQKGQDGLGKLCRDHHLFGEHECSYLCPIEPTHGMPKRYAIQVPYDIYEHLVIIQSQIRDQALLRYLPMTSVILRLISLGIEQHYSHFRHDEIQLPLPIDSTSSRPAEGIPPSSPPGKHGDAESLDDGPCYDLFDDIFSDKEGGK